MTSACHCSGCQKMTSSAFSLTALFATSDFLVTQGEPVIGGLRGATRHFFCPQCLGWLFSRPAGIDDYVGVRSSLLEDARRYAPFMETWTREKLPWAYTGARVSFEGFPDPQAYPALMARFAHDDPTH